MMISGHIEPDILMLRLGTHSSHGLLDELRAAICGHSRLRLRPTTMLLLDARESEGTQFWDQVFAVADFLATTQGLAGLRCAVLSPDSLFDGTMEWLPQRAARLFEEWSPSRGIAVRVFDGNDQSAAVEWLSAQRGQSLTDAAMRPSTGIADVVRTMGRSGKLFRKLAEAAALGFTLTLAELVLVSGQSIPFPVFIGDSNRAVDLATIPVPLDWLLGIPLFFAGVGFYIGAAWSVCRTEAKALFGSFEKLASRVWDSGLPQKLLFLGGATYFGVSFASDADGFIDVVISLAVGAFFGCILVLLGTMAFLAEVLLPLGLIVWGTFTAGSSLFGGGRIPQRPGGGGGRGTRPQ